MMLIKLYFNELKTTHTKHTHTQRHARQIFRQSL